MMKYDIKRILAHNLKRERWNHGWSQAFVARQLDISIRTISRAETGRGVSDKLLKRMCSLYRIPLSAIYKERAGDAQVMPRIDVIPDTVAVKLMRQSSFVVDIQRESILQFNDLIQKNAVMFREEVEDILPELISKKQTYSIADLIYCCMAVNHRTIQSIDRMAVGC